MLRATLGGAITLTCATTAAQEFPAKPVRMILSFPPGGGSDAIARPLAQRMAKSLGQPVFIDHRPGANGIVSLETLARAAPDGHTIALSNVGPIAMSPALQDKLPYDPLRGFAPIARVASTQYVLLVHPSLPARTVKQFLALARARPGAINYATTGVGSTPHLSGELLKHLTGIDIVGVQYKGGGPALIDVISGQVSMYFASAPSALPHLTSGRVVGIAVTGSKRSTAIPDLPTVAESGVTGYEVDGWYGVLAPAQTDGARVQRLATVIHEALRGTELVSAYAAQGVEVAPASPEAFAAVIEKEISKWTKVVGSSGIRVVN
jgi:tripartite-type tricarboxylate transporter receptor subunit TctC